VVVLGIILLVVAAALVLLMGTAGTSQDIVLDLIGGQRLTTSAILVFLAGAVTLALAEVGLWLISRGTRRAVARRREVRQLRRAAAASPDREDVPARDEPGTEAHPAGDEVGTAEAEPDRRLVRNVDDLRARERADATTGPARSPEAAVDPEGGRHELGLDDLESRQHRR
jgi:hypothetical protein